MNIGIIAPCAVPLVVGGAEKFWWGLERYINEHTPHAADIVKPPSPEHDLWSLVDSYRFFSQLDVSGFDLVVTSKYPAWIVRHERHVVYMFHKLRGLYDAYSGPLEIPPFVAGLALVRTLIRACDATRSGNDNIERIFEALEEIRCNDQLQRDPSFAFPGPIARMVVHALDAAAFAPGRVRKFGSLSREVASRSDYFPPGLPVTVIHPPTSALIHPGDGGDYFFTASRLDGPKRVELLVEAMARSRTPMKLKIAGTGPLEERIRLAALQDERIELLGHVSERELGELYAQSFAVLFAPSREDYGLITVEAMLAGKPVITTLDAGGPTELITNGVNGHVVAATPDAIARAIDELTADRDRARTLGQAGLSRAREITWQPIVDWMMD